MRAFILGSCLLALLGCSTNQPHSTTEPAAYTPPPVPRVGVALAGVTAPQLYLPGADCDACLADALQQNSELAGFVATSLQSAVLDPADSELLTRLIQRGVDPLALQQPININQLPLIQTPGADTAGRDFSGFQELEITHLLVIDLNQLGIARPYQHFDPAGQPAAVLKAAYYLIELHSNEYKWYKFMEYTQEADGNWNEPSAFPGLASAYETIFEEARNAIVAQF
jgi:hypothetical protein